MRDAGTEWYRQDTGIPVVGSNGDMESVDMPVIKLRHRPPNVMHASKNDGIKGHLGGSAG